MLRKWDMHFFFMVSVYFSFIWEISVELKRCSFFSYPPSFPLSFPPSPSLPPFLPPSIPLSFSEKIGNLGQTQGTVNFCREKMESLFSHQYSPSDDRLGHLILTPRLWLRYTFLRNSFLTPCQPEGHWLYCSSMEMVPWISGELSFLIEIEQGVCFLKSKKLYMKLELFYFCFVLFWYHQELFETK